MERDGSFGRAEPDRCGAGDAAERDDTAGYSFNITLTYTTDGTGTVTGANYTVTDNNGNNVGSASITIVGQTLRTTGLPATSANLAPLAALTFSIGGGLRGQRRDAFGRRGDDYVQRG